MTSNISINDFLTPLQTIDTDQDSWNIVEYASVVGLRLHTMVANNLPQYAIVPAIDPDLTPWFLMSLSSQKGSKKLAGPVIITDGDNYAAGFYSENNANGFSTVTLRRPRGSGTYNMLAFDLEIIQNAIRDISNIDDAPFVFGAAR